MATDEDVRIVEAFIAQCRATVIDRQTRRDTEQAQRKADYDALLALKIAEAVELLSRPVPAELKPFVAYIGQRPTLEQLESFPAGWTPDAFQVQAPGLVYIGFQALNTPEAGYHIAELSVDGKRYRPTQWTEAVADSAARFEFSQQDSR